MDDSAEKITIHAISQSLDLNISSGYSFLTRDAKLFIKNIVALANRINKAKHKNKLTVNDINESLRSKNMEPLYGYSKNEISDFIPIGNDQNYEIFARKEKMINLSQMERPKLAKYPFDTSFDFHWLAINGIQPCISNNQTDDSTNTVTPDEIHWPFKLTNLKEVPGRQTDPKVLVPEELQKLFYSTFIKIRNSENIDDVLEELSTNGSLHQLLPYYIRILLDAVAVNIRHPINVTRFLCVTNALLRNESLNFDNILHHILSIVLAPLTNDVLADGSLDIQYRIRDEAATLLGSVVRQFSSRFSSLTGIITEKLTNLFFDYKKSLIARYGAVSGLFEISTDFVRDTILPKLESIMDDLQPKLESTNENEKFQAVRLKSFLYQACHLICMKEKENNHEMEEEVVELISLYFGGSIFDS
ncbi:hypothetical protein TRFO_21953 [Tritrichomonas foetus]|uniref:TAF6 C-terminal HEAT repeat domain-containing protein n=1 Tax=Tritrichomonas foetus TaxID=1144522 RepID=A0A1J4KDE6_9EUKA|nr:hypothetical protein TRFO_21953 [Tritrichomonas foetus]|eukprot:OHT09219.1 hypothetical protein TRFO_21953 [Tritrichomonas foetus]